MNKTELTKANLAKILAGLGEIYDKKISTNMADIYLDILRDFSYEDVARAASLHQRNPDGGRFFPKPADFMRHLTGGSQDKALLAWVKLDKAVRQVGPYRSVVFDDALIHAVVNDMGGWISIGNRDDEQWPFVQNEFVKRYRAYTEKGALPPYVGKLTGIADAHNASKDLKCKDETVLLGDATLAMQVLKGGGASISVGKTLLSELSNPVLAIGTQSTDNEKKF